MVDQVPVILRSIRNFMDQQKILNKGITIQEIQMKTVKSGSKYALRDHEGKTFNFFTTKQDGSDTQVYSQFKNMGLKTGSTVTIGYVEDEFEIDGKKVISKKIINFRELSGEPSQTAPQEKSSHTEANRGQSGHFNDAFGRRLALHGFVNGMLASGATVDVIKRDLPALLSLEDAIDIELSVVRTANEELPVIQQDEYPPIEDIPY
jgi:hypothetical protein